jgi:bifunctional N-acetylglucosamine-1-phosphate-uridyltransferase/glucosamine-1-phosphate-acetyltransferase GlmU-like protein
MFSFSFAIMAGGKGKRMRSNLPKFLHKIHGKEMIARILEAITPLSVSTIYIIVNPEVESQCLYLKTDLFPHLPIEFVHQPEPLGTGHALRCLVESPQFLYSAEKKEERLIVLNADMPYLQTFLLQKIMDSFSSCLRKDTDAILMATRLQDPKGYGRIFLSTSEEDSSLLDHIEEDKDCKDPGNSLCNMGLYAFRVSSLIDGLGRLTNKNASEEYYLTQVFDFLDNTRVLVIDENEAIHLRGVNSPEELTALALEIECS